MAQSPKLPLLQLYLFNTGSFSFPHASCNHIVAMTTWSRSEQDKALWIPMLMFAFVCIPGGSRRQTVWDLGSRGGDGALALHQIWECLHRNLLGLYQRPPGQHWDKSHQGHGWWGTQIQRTAGKETETQVSTLMANVFVTGSQSRDALIWITFPTHMLTEANIAVAPWL